MRLRALLVACGLSLGGGVEAEDARPAAGKAAALSVSYRSHTAVYVSAGRGAGLAVGDRLAVMAGTETVAELEVVFLAEHSSSCRVLSEVRPVKAGDRVVRLGAPRPVPAPGPAPAASPAPGAEAAASPVYVRAATVRPAPGANRVTGGVSAGYSSFRDTSPAARNVTEQLGRFDLAVREFAGRPLEAHVRASGRRIERDNTRSLLVPAHETRQRIYEASVAWAPPQGRFAAAAGRLGGSPFIALGSLDGVLGQARLLPALQVGAFGGRTPDTLDVGVPSGAKYGAFLRLGVAGGVLPAELVLSGVREFAGSEISREYVGQQGQVRHGAFWLYERTEVDFNRGWRLERAGTGAELSEARVTASWRASTAADLSVSYELSRSYWSALTRTLASDIFDRRLRQGVRADLSLVKRNGVGIWMGGSVRGEEGSSERSYAANAGLRSPRFFSFDVAVDGSYYRAVTTQGVLASARAGRSLRGGHRLDAAYTYNRYQVGGVGWRDSHWLRGSAYLQVAGKAFARADVDYALRDDLPGLRGLAEIGYRF